MLLLYALLFIHYLPVKAPSLQDNDDEELLSYEELIREGAHIVQTDTIVNKVNEMFDSPDESTKKLAKDALQSLYAQMKDKSKRFARLTINEMKYIVNMGASGSALRSHNEDIVQQLWNTIVKFFQDVLCFIGVGDCLSSKDPIAISIDDGIFLLLIWEGQLHEVNNVLIEKIEILKQIEKSKHNVDPDVIIKLKIDSLQEELYRRRLKRAIEIMRRSIERAQEETAIEESRKLQEQAHQNVLGEHIV